MRRDFLKNLGIEDKDIIDKIMDENSADIGKAKGEVENLKTQIDTLTTEKKTVEDELSTLKDSTKDYESLKEQVATLTTEKTNLQSEFETKITQLTKTHDIENMVRDAKAKNVKAVMALIDTEGDVAEQLKTLTTGEDTSFLFGEAQVASPSGTQPNNPPSNGGNGNVSTGKSLKDAIAERLTN